MPSLLDFSCDAEMLHGLIAAAEVVMDMVEPDDARPGYARISSHDRKTLNAVLRAARDAAGRLSQGLGAIA